MGCHFSPPGDLPDSGIKPESPVSPALQVDSLLTELLGEPIYSIPKARREFLFWHLFLLGLKTSPRNHLHDFPLRFPMDMIKIHTDDIQVVRQAAAAKSFSCVRLCPTP